MVFSIPALIKIVCVFGLILLLNRLRVSLSLSLLSGAFTLGLWMKLSPIQLIQSAFSSLIETQTLALILIVGLILVISRLMKESGHMDRLLETFKSLSRDDRTAAVVMPALIGLLPMPGGALFSAPMVGSAFSERTLAPEKKTVVNYWFRHIWEYWWPLYPGVVLAVALLEVDTWHFMAIMCPMTLVTVLAGAVFILRPLGGHRTPREDGVSQGIVAFLWEIMPIAIVVFVIVLLACITGLAGLMGTKLEIPGAVSILPGLMASLVWVCMVNRIPWTGIRSATLNRDILPMLFLVISIMVFKGILMDSGAVSQIRNDLVVFNVPVMAVILIMPFLSGFITGIAIGFVGTSFPLIVPMFHSPDPFQYLPLAAMAYTFGYMGMMLSPVHLCFLVTKDYFEASLLASYRHLILPVLTVMAIAVSMFLIIRSLGAY